MPLKPSPFLLADPSACLRWLVMRDLLGLDASDKEFSEVSRLKTGDPLVVNIVQSQAEDGSWSPAALGAHWGSGNKITATAFALYRLGYLGFDDDFLPVRKGSQYLFAQQNAYGSWPLAREGLVLDGHMRLGDEAGYSMIPLQTAFPLRGLAACGYAEDPRAELAYEWLLAQRLPEGCWPTGIASGVYGYVAGYRKLSHSRWGCRSNTTGALVCFALHPARRNSAEARRALDLLLGRETREEYALGFEIARLIGAEQLHGYVSHFARFDVGLIAYLCWRLSASQDDQRVGGLVDFIRKKQGEYGLWYYPQIPQATRWVSFDLTRTLLHLEQPGEWTGEEPRTPFRAYPRQTRRFG